MSEELWLNHSWSVCCVSSFTLILEAFVLNLYFILAGGEEPECKPSFVTEPRQSYQFVFVLSWRTFAVTGVHHRSCMFTSEEVQR